MFPAQGRTRGTVRKSLEIRELLQPEPKAFARIQEDRPMEWKTLGTVFGTVFFAELGDKTQLATVLFAADQRVSKLTVFMGASLALVAASALGVAAGGLLGEYVDAKYLRIAVGLGFIGIGLWVLLRG
jgi:putative Ca2+/H+ antiporter (TMEM165/GDT1 family)